MISAPVILSLETATLGGSICLSRGTEVLAAREGNPDVSHSNSVLTDIESCLRTADLTLSEVELFACASGPGSFTGLRIGIATLKALAATLERPCVGVPTLNAIAHSAGQSNRTVALLPAGRGEVFAQSLSVSADAEVVELDKAMHLSPAKVIDRYRGFSDLVWAGVGAHLQRALLQEHAAKHAIEFVDYAPALQKTSKGWSVVPLSANLAQHVSSLALRRLVLGQLQNAESLKAIYVRPSDAEINQTCQ